jgi:hypothetical protein
VTRAAFPVIDAGLQCPASGRSGTITVMTSEHENHGPARDAGTPDSGPGKGPEGAGDRTAAPRGGTSPGTVPQYGDRCYRSPAAMAGGVLLLALALWLVGDTVLNGSGRAPWVGAAGLLFGVPLVVAYTLRPAVFAGEQRLRVRNPFRTVTVPWSSVESLQARYTSEVVADGKKYQLWSIPVSLRARKAAARHNARAASPRPSRGLLGFGTPVLDEGGPAAERRAPSDASIDELRELADLHGPDGARPAAAGPVTVRWAYEILVPAVLGGLALAALIVL